MEKHSLILIGLLCIAVCVSGQDLGRLRRMMMMRQRELALRRAFPFGIGGIGGIRRGIPPPAAARMAFAARQRAALLGVGGTGLGGTSLGLPFGFGSTFIGAPLTAPFGLPAFREVPFFGAGINSFGPTFGLPPSFGTETIAFPGGFGPGQTTTTFGETGPDGSVPTGGETVITAGDGSGNTMFGQQGTQAAEFMERDSGSVEASPSRRRDREPPRRQRSQRRDRPPDGPRPPFGRGPPRRPPVRGISTNPMSRGTRPIRPQPGPTVRPSQRLPPLPPLPGIMPSPQPLPPRLMRADERPRLPGPPRIPLINRPPMRPPLPPRLPPPLPLRPGVMPLLPPLVPGRRRPDRNRRQQQRRRPAPPAFPNVPQIPQIPAVTPPNQDQQVINTGTGAASGPGFTFPQPGGPGGFQFPTTPAFGNNIFPAQSTQAGIMRQRGPGFTPDTTIFSGSFNVNEMPTVPMIPGAPNGQATPFPQGSRPGGQMITSMTQFQPGFPNGRLQFPAGIPRFGPSEQNVFPGAFGASSFQPTFTAGGQFPQGPRPMFGGQRQMFDPRFGFSGQSRVNAAGPEFTTTNTGPQQGGEFNLNFQPLQPNQPIPGQPDVGASMNSGTFVSTNTNTNFNNANTNNNNANANPFNNANANPFNNANANPFNNANANPFNNANANPFNNANANFIDANTNMNAINTNFNNANTNFNNANTNFNDANTNFNTANTNFENANNANFNGGMEFTSSTSTQTGTGGASAATNTLVERNVNDRTVTNNQAAGGATSGATLTGSEFRVVEVGNILDNSGFQGATEITQPVTPDGTGFQPAGDINSAFNTLTITDTTEPVVDLSIQSGAASAGSSSRPTVVMTGGSNTDQAGGSGESSATKTVVTTRTVSRNSAPFPSQTDFSFFAPPDVMPPIATGGANDVTSVVTGSGAQSAGTGNQITGGSKKGGDGFQTIFTEFFGIVTGPKSVNLYDAPPAPAPAPNAETISFRITGTGGGPGLAENTGGAQGFSFTTTNTGNPENAATTVNERTVVETLPGESGFMNINIPPPDLVSGNGFQ